MQNVERALVIAEPWIGMILEGTKVWEMRSRATKIRGPIGLIRKGTGSIWGVANLVSCGDALMPEDMIASFSKHRIPEAMIRSGQVAKWNRPWALEGTRALSSPVSYVHNSGAVTWVTLDREVSDAINQQLTA